MKKTIFFAVLAFALTACESAQENELDIWANIAKTYSTNNYQVGDTIIFIDNNDSIEHFIVDECEFYYATILRKMTFILPENNETIDAGFITKLRSDKNTIKVSFGRNIDKGYFISMNINTTEDYNSSFSNTPINFTTDQVTINDSAGQYCVLQKNVGIIKVVDDNYPTWTLMR